jgi:hypothetical protein
MTTRRAFEPSVPPLSEADMLDERMDTGGVEDAPGIESPGAEGRGTTFALWLAAGAIVGTGASWTLGGTTSEGVAAGMLLGALTGWGWVRWTSPR